MCLIGNLKEKREGMSIGNHERKKKKRRKVLQPKKGECGKRELTIYISLTPKFN